MRLTAEILSDADECVSEQVAHALALAAAGRFGLFPSVRPFRISADIDKNVLDVVSLECLAVTRGGSLIDVRYDGRFSSAVGTQVIIPEHGEDRSYLLTVHVRDGAWQETDGGHCEPVYAFALTPENSALPDDGFPVARIVHEYGWRLDEVDFVPPCLYLSSHPKYLELAGRFSDLLRSLHETLLANLDSDGRDVIRILLPAVRRSMIVMDKERDTMTPMKLLSEVQQCAGAFLCGCQLDRYIRLGEPETFRNFVDAPYDYRTVYEKIREGLKLCVAIGEKAQMFRAVEEPAPEPVKPAPAPKPKRLGWMGKEI